MFYKEDSQGNIIETCVENYDGLFKETDKNIVQGFDGGFVFEEETKTEDYKRREQIHKTELKNRVRIAEIKPRLEQLSQDIIQSLAGAEFEDMAERQKEFQTLHNELRILLGKEPRKYLEVDNETNN